MDDRVRRDGPLVAPTNSDDWLQDRTGDVLDEREAATADDGN